MINPRKVITMEDICRSGPLLHSNFYFGANRNSDSTVKPVMQSFGSIAGGSLFVGDGTCEMDELVYFVTTMLMYANSPELVQLYLIDSAQSKFRRFTERTYPHVRECYTVHSSLDLNKALLQSIETIEGRLQQVVVSGNGKSVYDHNSLQIKCGEQPKVYPYKVYLVNITDNSIFCDSTVVTWMIRYLHVCALSGVFFIFFSDRRKVVSTTLLAQCGGIFQVSRGTRKESSMLDVKVLLNNSGKNYSIVEYNLEKFHSLDTYTFSVPKLY